MCLGRRCVGCGDNLCRRAAAICVYPDARHRTEVECPHYYHNVFRLFASAESAHNCPYRWERERKILKQYTHARLRTHARTYSVIGKRENVFAVSECGQYVRIAVPLNCLIGMLEVIF